MKIVVKDDFLKIITSPNYIFTANLNGITLNGKSEYKLQKAQITIRYYKLRRSVKKRLILFK